MILNKHKDLKIKKIHNKEHTKLRLVAENCQENEARQRKPKFTALCPDLSAQIKPKRKKKKNSLLISRHNQTEHENTDRILQKPKFWKREIGATQRL